MTGKRVFVVGLMLLLAVFVFASGPQEKKATAGNPLQGKTVAVLVWPMSILDPVHAIVSEFEKMTGAKVIMDPMGEEALRQKQMTEFASGKIVHNVVLVDMYGLAAQEKYVMPLDDLMKSKGGAWEGLHDFSYNDFDKFMREVYIYNNKTLGIPYYWEVAGLHYRKDLLQEAGLAVPTTYTEYRDAAQKLTKDTDGDGKTDIYGTAQRSVRGEDSGLMSAGAAYSFGSTMFEGGAATGPEIKAKKAKPRVNSKEWIEAFTFYGDLLHKYAPPGVTSYSWTEVMRDFEEGKIAMDIDANYFVGMYNNPAVSKVAGKADLALPPKGPGGKYYQHPFVCALGIPQGAPDVDAAWEFIKWYTCKSTVGRSIVPGFRLTPTIPALMATAEYKKAFGDTGEKLLKTLAVADWKMMPIFPESDEPTFLIGDAWSSVVAGTKNPKQALDAAQAAILKIMTEAGYYK